MHASLAGKAAPLRGAPRGTWLARRERMIARSRPRTRTLALAAALCLAPAVARADEPPPLPAPSSPVEVAPPPAPPTAPPPPAQPPVAAPAPSPIDVRAAPPPYVAPDREEPMDTVFSGRARHGGYGAPSLKVTSLAGDALMLAGVEGGWIIGRGIVVGAAGYMSVTSVVSPASLQSASGDARMRMSYAGGRFGGILRPLKRQHFTLGVLVGGGGATAEDGSDTFRRSETFLVVEPDLGYELNLAENVRFGVSGSYRFVGGAEAPGFTPTRLGGPAAAFALRFGVF